MRSILTSVRQILDSEHNVPSAGGNNVGYHALGSARPFYGLQSAVSSSGSDGRLMLTSDTSQLFGVGSGGTVFLGGPRVVSAGSYPGVNAPQRCQWCTDFGVDQTGGAGTKTVTFPNSGYSGAAFVVVTAVDTATAGVHCVLQTEPTDVNFLVRSYKTVGLASNVTFHWMSMGTRTL